MVVKWQPPTKFKTRKYGQFRGLDHAHQFVARHAVDDCRTQFGNRPNIERLALRGLGGGYTAHSERCVAIRGTVRGKLHGCYFLCILEHLWFPCVRYGPATKAITALAKKLERNSVSQLVRRERTHGHRDGHLVQSTFTWRIDRESFISQSVCSFVCISRRRNGF